MGVKEDIKREHIQQRIFEILPGLTFWLVLSTPFWISSLNLAHFLANLVVVFAVFWLYRAVIFLIGLYIGYNRYKAALETDWLAECKKLNFENLPNPETLPQNSKLPKHLVVYPVGGAKYETLKRTLSALDDQNYPDELIYISLSFEQRLVEKEPAYYADMKDRIKKEFSHFGNRLMIFEHPKDIPGEAIGAAANRTWGTKNAVEVLEKAGENIADFIITSPDEDLRFHHEYLGCVSYHYLLNPEREKRFYQTALYKFSNNFWQIPVLIRTWASWLTLAIFSSSVTHLSDRETWSCYSVNLKVMKEVGYWDVSIGIDDTTFFWRPFDYFNGNFECESFYIPLYADAVYHPSKIKNYVAQYKQLVRWGWGVVAFPIAMKVLTTNKNIPLFLKIKKLKTMFEIIILHKLSTIILTLFIPLITFFSLSFSYSTLSYSIPQTISLIMTILTTMLIPVSVYRYLLHPKRPDAVSKIKQVIEFFAEIPLHILILYTYNLFPYIVGPTKMMLGHNYRFVVTEKK